MTDLIDDDSQPTDEIPGLVARRCAMLAIDDLLIRSLPLDETLDRILSGPDGKMLSDRDRGLARAIAMAATRRLGTIGEALMKRLEKGLPDHSGRLESILVAGVAQLLYLDVPDHAAVDLSVRLVQADPEARRFIKLANGLLRTIARERDVILSNDDPLNRDTPEWLAEKWIKAYGEEDAKKIAAANMQEASVDITVKKDAPGWAERLDAVILSTGSLRLKGRTNVVSLPGYVDGEWWVQDAAAALPAMLLDPKPGETIADLCAAPGGKTAQLAAAGATVTAIDRSSKRLERLSENMTRLRFSVESIAIDAMIYSGGPFDAILLDAPCTATGTIRRHPDVLWTKEAPDLQKLAALQARLLKKAIGMLKPGGRLVYCTCSLEPEEGESQIAELLAMDDRVKRSPFGKEEMSWLGPELARVINGQGELRTLPYMLPNEDPRLQGIDGFFAARLVRT
jgi:16S rRNA (cytosine967-C5)-methyltransferase